ncbi:MAG: isochorismatase family protein [Gammaproteobacteria bacterium]
MTEKKTALICDSENSALIVIDIQTHLTAVMPAKVLARLQRYTGLLINAAKTLDIPIFATEQYPRGLGNMEEDLATLLPENAKRYEKTCFSCINADNFLNDLSQLGRKQIVLAGMEAHVCVLQTAIDLLNLDFQVVVVADAVCSRHRESYETALQRLRQSGTIISNAESIIFEWIRDARHEHFKTLQQLLR